jgi:dTDP-4-amino-4,6-dideoxygalactose transaminase
MTTTVRVPQVDLRAGYLELKPELDAALARALDSGWYILGGEVGAFEAEFAAYIGVPHAIGVANGTDAVALALRGLGIGPGEHVATVAHTAVATVAAIESFGAVPVLVDIDPARYTMDPASLERAVAAHPVRAVVAVHLYGQAADLASIGRIAREAGAVLIEDCAQAHGATLDGHRLGGIGDAAAFSLYPTKNLGALGDGGVVTTRDPAVAERIGALRQYGWRERYVSDLAGVNSRLDELQAAMLRVKLQRLDADNARRAAVAARYDRAIGDAATGSSAAGTSANALTPPSRFPGCGHVFHQYVLRCADRAAVQSRLKEAGIGTNIHYPVPIHLQPAYRGRVPVVSGGLPHTERAAREVLSLPMYPQLDDAQVEAVCTALRQPW